MSHSLADFERLFVEGFTYQLPLEVRQTIEALTKEVGAPGYVCTPSFEKKHIVFKPPAAKESNPLDDIRKNMNKISDRTFDALKDKIIADIERADVGAIGEVLFAIASGNAFYSKLYARLYKILCDTFEGIEPPTTPAFVFAKPIEYCSPNEDYDQYCENTKANEQRRALALFCVNLLNEDATDDTIVLELIDTIRLRFLESIMTPETKPVADELSELLYVVLVNAKARLRSHERWGSYVAHVEDVTKMKQTADNGVTSKCVFKHMDLLDDIRPKKYRFSSK